MSLSIFSVISHAVQIIALLVKVDNLQIIHLFAKLKSGNLLLLIFFAIISQARLAKNQQKGENSNDSYQLRKV